MQNKSIRARWFGVICYPDSMPSDWVDSLDKLYLQFAVSPLHDKDVFDDGTPKKPHYHCVFYFDGKKSIEQFNEILSSCCGTGFIEPRPIDCPSGAIQYFIHKNHPDKYQYNIGDIRVFGGLDIASAYQPSWSEQVQILKDITEYVEKYRITSFHKLAFYAAHENLSWFYVISKTSTGYINSLCRSQYEYSKHIGITISENDDTSC